VFCGLVVSAVVVRWRSVGKNLSGEIDISPVEADASVILAGG